MRFGFLLNWIIVLLSTQKSLQTPHNNTIFSKPYNLLSIIQYKDDVGKVLNMQTNFVGLTAFRANMFNIQILTIVCFMRWMSKRCQEKKHTNKDRKRGWMIQSPYHMCILLSRRTFLKINTIETFWECFYMPMMLSITCVDDWNSKIFLQFY